MLSRSDRILLREQLHTVLGFASILGEAEGLSDKQRLYARYIHDAGEALLHLLTEKRRPGSCHCSDRHTRISLVGGQS